MRKENQLMAEDDLIFTWLLQFRSALFIAMALASVYVFMTELVDSTDVTHLLVLLTVHILYGVSNIILGLSSIQKTNIYSESLRTLPVVGVLLLDVILLSALFHVSGGAENPFTLFYLAHITLALSVVGFMSALIVALFSILGYASLFLMPLYPTVVPRLHEHATHHHQISHSTATISSELGFDNHLFGMFIAFVLTSLLIIFFLEKLGSIRKRLRKTEEALKIKKQEHYRLASLAALSAQSAHELATPLGTIQIISESLRSSAIDDHAVAELDELERQVTRSKELLRQMVLRGGGVVAEGYRSISLSSLSEELRSYLSQRQKNNELNIEVRCPEGDKELSLRLPYAGFLEALVCLFDNAQDAGATICRIDLSVRSRNLVVSFFDNGKGIAPEVLVDIGRPFASTKDPAEGMGLGLFVVKLYCEQLGGNMKIDSMKNSGTVISLELPIVERDRSSSYKVMNEQ